MNTIIRNKSNRRWRDVMFEIIFEADTPAGKWFIFLIRFWDYPKLKAQYKRFPEYRRKTIHTSDSHDAAFRSFLEDAKEGLEQVNKK